MRRSTLTYGTECWALTAEDKRKLKTTEMICGKTLKDKINNMIREMTGKERLEEFLREAMARACGENG